MKDAILTGDGEAAQFAALRDKTAPDVPKRQDYALSFAAHRCEKRPGKDQPFTVSHAPRRPREPDAYRLLPVGMIIFAADVGDDRHRRARRERQRLQLSFSQLGPGQRRASPNSSAFRSLIGRPSRRQLHE
jgi:hypothetical protein